MDFHQLVDGARIGEVTVLNDVYSMVVTSSTERTFLYHLLELETILIQKTRAKEATFLICSRRHAHRRSLETVW